MKDLVQVYFLKSPTAPPFKLAYHVGMTGFVLPGTADKLVAAGIAKKSAATTTYKTAEEVEAERQQLISIGTEADPEVTGVTPEVSLTTVAEVKKHFGVDLDAMKEYCKENKIRVHHSVKRPEAFYAKIVAFNNK